MKRYEIDSIPEYLSVSSIVVVLSKVLGKTPVNQYATNTERHDFPELLYIKEGSHVQVVAGELYPISKGQMMIYAPLDPHTGGGEQADACILSFKADFGKLPSIFNRVITLTKDQCTELERIIDAGTACYEQRAKGSNVGGMIIREGVSEYSLHKLKRDLELFLIDVYKSEGLLNSLETSGKKLSRREQFDVVAIELRSKVGEKLTIEDIAKMASMSVSKLKMLFREYAGTGPINFFIELKLEHAKELIRRGELTLSEISESLGFSSLSYFSRLFKSRLGLSPLEWEKQNCKK